MFNPPHPGEVLRDYLGNVSVADGPKSAEEAAPSESGIVRRRGSIDDALFAPKPRKAVPHEFVLDALTAVSPRTNPMFGCLAVYVGDKIVLILRDKRGETADNGVWLATTPEHHASLRREFPNMRSIQLFGTRATGWQVLPADAPDFEESALRACELIVARDPRIGKVPKANKRPKARR
jgi:hypothetical protein